MKSNGRTSGTAYAQVNGVMADCRFICPLLVGSPSYTTQEWVVIGSTPQRVIANPGDSGTFFIASPVRRRLEFPVACIMFGGAHVSWLQEKAGNGSLARIHGERVRSPEELWNNLYYDSEIAIVTPATRVLGWLAESLGGEYEFGDEGD
jgi:hypothetical protein